MEGLAQDEKFAEMQEFMKEDQMSKWLIPVHNNECYLYELTR